MLDVHISLVQPQGYDFDQLKDNIGRLVYDRLLFVGTQVILDKPPDHAKQIGISDQTIFSNLLKMINTTSCTLMMKLKDEVLLLVAQNASKLDKMYQLEIKLNQFQQLNDKRVLIKFINNFNFRQFIEKAELSFQKQENVKRLTISSKDINFITAWIVTQLNKFVQTLKIIEIIHF